jgi:heme-degrading monooxygenase HmoA
MLSQMGLARPVLQRTAGLRFWKLLGMGHGNGFSLRPDWNGYGVIGVWDNSEAACHFLHLSAWMQAVRRRADEVWTAFLQPAQSRGLWSGVNPFAPAIAQPGAGLVVVLTRATIRLSKLRAFWSAVPGTSDAMAGHAGLILSVGVGEAPFGRQATLSIWRDEAAVRAYAHKEQAHVEVIRRTREEGWYAEELFARFVLVGAEGLWAGGDPLK